MRNVKIKHFVLLLGLVLSVAWGNAEDIHVIDGHSHIAVKAANVQGAPKGSSIHASIDGHTLVVAFAENLGDVAVEISTASGVTVENLWAHTPNGLQTYLPLCGDYVITFTLPNGDEYYGEFTVTD